MAQRLPHFPPILMFFFDPNLKNSDQSKLSSCTVASHVTVLKEHPTLHTHLLCSLFYEHVSNICLGTVYTFGLAFFRQMGEEFLLVLKFANFLDF